MINQTSDLEIGVHRHDANTYSVDFRFNQPESDSEVRLSGSVVPINPNELSTLEPNSDAYAQKLTDALFGDNQTRESFAQAIASAESIESPLSIRIAIGPSAPELHSLVWERLLNPLNQQPLCTNQNIRFSRYLSSTDFQPVRRAKKGNLRALVVVANPINLDRYNLASIDAEKEIGLARKSLGDIEITTFPGKLDQHATLGAIMDCLTSDQANHFDIFYLACHGAMARGEPHLWLEDDDGQTAITRGEELARRIRELRIRPRLVVLASCESAGDREGLALAALGPRLAEAGVPAVLAMQGKIDQESITQFMPIFFRSLQEEGAVDLAVATARNAIQSRHDHWMPVLYMRLRSGRLWYLPGFGGEEDEFEKWESLQMAIEEEVCTPIIGYGLIEPLLGSRREIALRWAIRHGYPLSPNDRDDMPRVAQFVVTRQSPTYLRSAFREAVKDEIIHRYDSILPKELTESSTWSSKRLLEALDISAEHYWKSQSCNPYTELAKLHLPIYITANTGNLLSNALIAEGAEPQMCICPWNEIIPKAKCIYEEMPSREQPLVYHLFGHISEPFSLVLTEDEHFDYLIGVTTNRDLIPSAVRAALTSTALLFLGFSMEDWSFRIFFRMIMAQEGREQLRLFSHASVQVEPDEGHITDETRARRYLEKYFESEKISLYWGTSEDFLCELASRLV